MIKMTMEKKIRLDKYLVHTGYGSRSEVQKLIKQKRVEVEGKIINKPEYSLPPETTLVTVDGKEVVYKPFYHFIMNKPKDVITATEDKVHKTVLDLLDRQDQNKNVAPVGRLDKDTEGLLILTSDGTLAHNLLSPKKHVDKVYYARVDGRVTEEDVRAFEEGIVLNEEIKLMPSRLEIIHAGDISEVYVTLAEGKFHQVKRMMHAIGKEVVYLKRVKMGGLDLPEDIGLGAYRELTEEELKLLKGE